MYACVLQGFLAGHHQLSCCWQERRGRTFQKFSRLSGKQGAGEAEVETVGGVSWGKQGAEGRGRGKLGVAGRGRGRECPSDMPRTDRKRVE